MLHTSQRKDTGSVLFVSLVLVMSLVGMTTAMLMVVTAARQENRASHDHMRCLYAAEAGIERALLDISTGGTGSMGTENAPIGFDASEFWVTTTDNGDDTFTVTAEARLNAAERALQATVVATGRVFDHAVFAGNSSNDPGYELNFGGSADQADQINGDVYSGQDIVVVEDAVINGTARSAGAVIGTTGISNVRQPIPDLQAMGYETKADVNVNDEFAAQEVWQSDDAGGTAWQLPESNPAHIFRKNPNDRNTENLSTVKDDFYLEDPYTHVGRDTNWDGTDAFEISVPGTPNNRGAVRKVYYIEGNLWLHNIPTYSFKMTSLGNRLELTIVVKGDIIISDNLFYDHPDRDGVALIALKDPDVPGSGNIYFGDPRGGTIETVYGFLYAENNFYDVNLDAAGSKRVILNGTMSAGNHVDIQRDFNGQHSQLIVNYDQRMKNGDLDLPMIPVPPQQLTYTIASWHEVQPE